ncbi:MAG: DUF423 domain-containing protein [Deltaproteobacteria bacterium]|nr:DUF423 domain-containing protein [Deltaproteobacteria bacterium]
MDRWYGALGAILGALGVAAGAFGAHALRARLEARQLEIWETAARYQLFHAVALVFVGLWLARGATTSGRVAGGAMLAGTVIFSGSLYLLVLTGRTWLGAITPVGGVLLIVGWVALALASWPAR